MYNVLPRQDVSCEVPDVRPSAEREGSRRQRRQPSAEPGSAGREPKAADDVRVAVVGHVEWIEFVRVERVPLQGEIVHALETWEEAAGGGAVAAVQLARLNGSVEFFTAV